MTITKFKIQTIHINFIETKKLEINCNCKSLFQLHEFKNKIHCLVATNTVSLILNPFFTEIIYTKKTNFSTSQRGIRKHFQIHKPTPEMEQNQQSFRYVTSNNNSTKGKRKSHRRAVSGVNTHTYTNLAKKRKNTNNATTRFVG